MEKRCRLSPVTNKDFFAAFDDELHKHLLSFLTGQEIALLVCVSSFWRSLLSDQTFWRDQLFQEWNLTLTQFYPKLESLPSGNDHSPLLSIV